METILAFVNSVAGLLLAIGTLATGLAAVLKAQRRPPPEHGTHRGSASAAPQGLLLCVGITLLLTSVTIVTVRAAGPEPQPKNVVLTSAAWAAFNAKDYSQAIARATACVQEFRAAARREQAELERQNVPPPPTGHVPARDRDVIIARGLLNDVATCYFIIGRSQEYLGRTDEARDAYRETTHYPSARTWDPSGWFWSPAQAAEDRAAGLR